ncbi:glycosyltransferase, partial [Calditrichota bacterium]
NFIGGIIGRFSGVKASIGGIRSSIIDRKKVILNRLLHNYINKYTIFNNYSGVENLSRIGFKKNKCIVIPNAIEINKYPIKRNYSKVINILSVGRFHPAKDYYTSLMAIKILSKKLDHFKYYIIGYGYLEKEIRKLINDFGLTNFVTIKINPNNIGDFYIKSHIYLLTSIYEGLSNTIMEAMSYSLPIVATNVGDNNRLVKNGVNGFIEEVKDYNGISECLFKLITQYKNLEKFGNNSFKILKENYSFEQFQKRYFNFLKNLDNV